MNFRRVFLLKRVSYRKPGECIAVMCSAKADGFNLCAPCRKKLTLVLEYNRGIGIIDDVAPLGDKLKG